MQTIHKFWLFLFGLCFAAALIPATAAPEQRSERITFSKGKNSAVLKNRIKGYESVVYLLGAKAGQQMQVQLETSNASNYFNLTAPGAEEAMHIGSSAGSRYEGVLPSDGDYKIDVYLMRNAARRNETAAYNLSVSITGVTSAQAAPAKDFADGLSGGPDFWEVTGLADGDSLNLRTQASSKSEALAQLSNHAVVRNQGCKLEAGQRWCKIEQLDGKHFSGWVAGRFLREAAAPGTDATLNSSAVKGTGKPFQATGEIPCATVVGQPTSQCPFGVYREGPGKAAVWIKTHSGSEREIQFEAGKPMASNTASELSFEKSGDLFLIRIGKEERYEIPEAVVFGG